MAQSIADARSLQTLKTANVPAGLAQPLRDRWSPRAFSDQPVSPDTLKLLFNAAQWSASSYNEQPWRFIVADRAADPEGYTKLLGILVERNQAWARKAPVLALSLYKKTFTHNNTPNRHAFHDAGAALGAIATQAAALGLHVHAMAGYNASKARVDLNIPEDFEPASAFAIGYAGDPESLSEDFRKAETSPRTRKPLEELVFSPLDWGVPAKL